MSTRKFLIVINPISGTANKEKIADAAQRCMDAVGIEGHIRYTDKQGDAFDFARQAVNDGYDTVIAVGGDGTVNEIASAICGSPVRLGIIPCGSGNGLARHLGLPLEPIDALKIIFNGHFIPCDYATANGKPFFCTFGVGFDARVSHAFSKVNRRGKFAYLRVIIRESKSYKPVAYRVTTDEGQFTRQAIILAVCNSSQYGNNAFIAPHASLTDGLLDLTVVNTANPVDLARNAFELFTGLITTNRRFETQKSKRITIECASEMEGHIDGEPVMFPKKIEIKCHPNSLNVYCDGESEFRPIITPFQGAVKDIRVAINDTLSGL